MYQIRCSDGIITDWEDDDDIGEVINFVQIINLDRCGPHDILLDGLLVFREATIG